VTFTPKRTAVGLDGLLLPYNDPAEDSLFVKLAHDRCRCTVCETVVSNTTEARDAHLSEKGCHC
jgi:hypothetical protein